MSKASNPSLVAASSVYELEEVSAPLIRRVLGSIAVLVVGFIGAGETVPYRNKQLIVRDRSTGEILRTIVPGLANAVDEIADARHSWETESKAKFDDRWLWTAD